MSRVDDRVVIARQRQHPRLRSTFAVGLRTGLAHRDGDVFVMFAVGQHHRACWDQVNGVQGLPRRCAFLDPAPHPTLACVTLVGQRRSVGGHKVGHGRLCDAEHRAPIGEGREDQGQVATRRMPYDGRARGVNAVQSLEMTPSTHDVTDRFLPHPFVTWTPAPVLHVPDDHAGLRQGIGHRRHERPVEGLLPKASMDEHYGGRALIGGERSFLGRKVEVRHVVRPVAPANFLPHGGRWWGGSVNLSAQGLTRRRSRGNKTVSRTFLAPVKTIRIRSTPRPQPACGGTPWRKPAT